MDWNRKITLGQHAEIVRAIHAEYAMDLRMFNILVARPGADGHRYTGERCVWCGINQLDQMIEEPRQVCPGPQKGEWSDDFWPLDKMDELLAIHRGWDLPLATRRAEDSDPDAKSQLRYISESAPNADDRERLCGDWPAPCNCDDPATHDGASL